MSFQHTDLAKGRWQKLCLAEQLGNIGSEVHRALMWQGKDKKRFDAAVLRALELFDLTIGDARWRGRLREIARAREIFCDAVFGGSLYGSSLEELDRYFLQFALLARSLI
jgi:hypothetical protein